MQLVVLGTVGADDGGAALLDLGGPAHRRLIAGLVAAGPSGLSTDQLVEHQWGDSVLPSDPGRSIRTYVSRLRRELGASSITSRTGGGYALGKIETDAARFEALAAQARRTGDSPTAPTLWATALDLWRGPAFDGLQDLPLIQPTARRLDELRAEALEASFEARLVSGERRELVADVEAAVAQHPLRDGLRAVQMTVLAGAGRQGDALNAFQEFRSDLTEIGLEPSGRMQELDADIASGNTLTPTVTRTLRGYELSERLGEGAFSVVYRAEQASVGRQVAVKQIRAELANRPEFIRQFEAEAHLVARLEHPHIVPLYDYWREPGSAYLVMRYLRGGSLAGELLNGSVGLERVVAIASQVAEALDESHRRGVVHRDVKPANILLDDDGRAYLSDFGIAIEEAESVDPEAWLSNGSPAYASPEQLRREAVGPASDIHGLAIVVFEALTGRLPFPDESTIAALVERQLSEPIPLVRSLLPDIPVGVDVALQKATAKVPADRYASAGEFARHLAAGSGLSPEVESLEVQDRNPYKGLRAFDEADAADFSGRERLVDKLLSAVVDHRVAAVVGPSGSGKSSVVSAGLLPAIRAGRIKGSGSWFVTTMIPGVDPFADLEGALQRVAAKPSADLAAELHSDRGLARTFRQLVPDGTELLLVIDQFEELFTVSSQDDRRRFLDAIVDAAVDEGSALRVVLTMRADFYDHPLRHPAFAQLIEQSTVTVHPLAADELERAITEPARSVGAVFESGLVARITADVADAPGALPLLQYALTELFDAREGNRLTIDAYERLGGVTGALARKAEELYEEASVDSQQAIRSLFGRLVTLGEGVEDTRRRVRRSELAVDQTTSDVLVTFGAARLLAFDRDAATREPTVEVAHEALIREWPRLRGWLDEDRDGLRILRHLSDTAESWNSDGRPNGELYRAGRLEAATEWADDQPLALTDIEAAFLAASTERQQAEQAAERRTNRRLRRLLAGVGIVAVLALIAGGVAFAQQREASTQRDLAAMSATEAEQNADRAEVNAAEAQQQTRDADLRRMVAESVDLADGDERLALLVAVAAYRTDPTPATLGAIQRVLMETPRGWQMTIDSTVGTQVGVEFISDDRLLIAGREGLSVVDLATGSEIERLDYTDTVEIDSARDTDRVAIAGDEGWTVLDSSTWDVVASGAEGIGVSVVGLSDDGETIALGERDGSVILVGVDGEDTEPVVVPFADAPGHATRLEFDAAGERLAIVGESNRGAAIWDLVAGTWIEDDIRLGISPALSGAFDVAWDGDQLWVIAFDQLAAVDGRNGSFLGEPMRVDEADLFLALDDKGDLVLSDATGGLYRSVSDQWRQVAHPGSSFSGIVGMETSADSPLAVIMNGSETTNNNVVLLSLDGSAGLVQHRFPANGDVVRITESGSMLVNENPAGVGPVGEARFFDLDETTPVARRLPPTDRIARWTFPFDQDESFFIIGEDESGEINRIGLWEDGVLRDIPHEWEPPQGGGISTIELSPDNTHAIIAQLFGQPAPIWVLDLETGEFVADLDAVEQVYDEEMAWPFAFDAEFTPDGERLVVTTGRDTVQVYDTNDWSPIGQVIPIDDGFLDIVFSRDGETALTWAQRDGLAIRDAATFEILLGPSLSGLAQANSWNGQMLDYVADERYAIKSSANAGSQVIDLDTLEPVGAPFPFDTDFRNAAVARDASILATVVGDELIVWNVNPDEWPDIACSMANRNMTEEEWERFGPIDQPYRESCPR